MTMLPSVARSKYPIFLNHLRSIEPINFPFLLSIDNIFFMVPPIYSFKVTKPEREEGKVSRASDHRVLLFNQCDAARSAVKAGRQPESYPAGGIEKISDCSQNDWCLSTVVAQPMIKIAQRTESKRISIFFILLSPSSVVKTLWHLVGSRRRQLVTGMLIYVPLIAVPVRGTTHD